MSVTEKKWEILDELGSKKQALRPQDIVTILLKNRKLETEQETEEFLHPILEDVTVDSVGIDRSHLQKSIKRIKQAIAKQEQIVVFGDYDVDGICGSAILWETLHSLGAKALPYIPHRIDEGYGLSIKGIQNAASKIEHIALIITVDNGIVANHAVDFANEQGIDVIITDHHVPSTTPPNANAIVHTTALCGTGVAYLLAKEILNSKSQILNKSKNQNTNDQRLATSDQRPNDHLALVALATVADLVPLKGANRTLLYYGLQVLRNTDRLGIKELCREAAVNQKDIDTYAIGHQLAPRLNAAGRMEYAMDSLRLLCTTKPERAQELAYKLGATNKERQQVTIETVQHAIQEVKSQNAKVKSLLFVAHETYPPGVIGLVAGRLVEEFYRPSIVLSIGETYSKASARSIAGFNIIDFIRTASEHLVDAGGHPMAAGFTVETAKLKRLQQALEAKAEELLTEAMMHRIIKIDCELPLDIITTNVYEAIQQLAPFGMANYEPVFMSKDVIVSDFRFIGRDQKHLKLQVQNQEGTCTMEAIAFGMAERAKDFHLGDKLDIAYYIDINEWNNQRRLQLKVRDFKTRN